MNTQIACTYDEYDAIEAVRKSDLDYIHRSPAHYIANKSEPKDTPSLLWGRMFHSFMLEPDLFDATYAVVPEGIDKRTKDGKAQWQDWQDCNPGKIPVNKPDLEELTAMRDAVFTHSKAKNALQGGIAETTLFWEIDGVACKARPDYITDSGLIVDLKTCQDARPEEFSKSCWKYRYHVQAAWYTVGYRAVFGKDPAGFLFLPVEKTKPYGVACYTSELMIEQGWLEAYSDFLIYKQCLETDTWPSYSEDVVSLDLPRWARMEAA